MMNRRDFVRTATTATVSEVRPFPRLNVPEAELDDLRRRIKATRWPSKELVNDNTQGVRLAMAQALATYWASDYDWRKLEATPSHRWRFPATSSMRSSS